MGNVGPELLAWWDALSESDKDLLREHAYESVLPPPVRSILATCPEAIEQGDAGWWPKPVRWLLHQDDPGWG